MASVRTGLDTPWSTADVGTFLLRSTSGLRGRLWLASYLLARRAPAPVRQLAAGPARRPAALRLKDLAAPLHVSAESGGVATYYEIVGRRIYAPVQAFLPQPGQTVVDVGANIGVFSLDAAGRVGGSGRVVAVEPHPLAFELLSRNLGPYERRTVLVNVACGARDGRLALHSVPGRLSVSSLHTRPDRTESTEVRVLTLDAVVSAHGIGAIDLLKLDVEGSELDVIAGARETLDRTARVVMELSSQAVAEVRGLLAEHGLEQMFELRGMWGIADAMVAHFARPGALP
jgi:FkbM family methyltransferase